MVRKADLRIVPAPVQLQASPSVGEPRRQSAENKAASGVAQAQFATAPTSCSKLECSCCVPKKTGLMGLIEKLMAKILGSKKKGIAHSDGKCGKSPGAASKQMSRPGRQASAARSVKVKARYAQSAALKSVTTVKVGSAPTTFPTLLLHSPQLLRVVTVGYQKKGMSVEKEISQRDVNALNQAIGLDPEYLAVTDLISSDPDMSKALNKYNEAIHELRRTDPSKARPFLIKQTCYLVV
jgi:hypothetical protein